ncbi:MAG: hypothetical protein IT168_22365 [Bryobacterales bacterium]|nr:hypothetical protein [Bryobacterales bacterium]
MRLLLLLLAAMLTFAQEDTGPPRIKRGVPKGTDPRGESRPESTPIPIPREIVTDENGRVIETRGGTTATTTSASEAANAPATGTTATVAAIDPIDKAREVAFNFSEQLPNFFCQQVTFRYSGEGRRNIEWKLQDRIELELMFIDGKESYRNVKRNGKVLKSGNPQETGTWSTGEYATISLDVLASNTAARFKPLGDSDVGGRPARKFSYVVDQPNSHWKIDFGSGPVLYPAYKGAVWIDKQTDRVLRVEMIARQIPESYPMDVVEMTVDYGMVKIGQGEYLLPTRAENLACGRLSVTCTRNEVTYKNYRKFTAESTMSTTDSSVTFDGESKGPQLATPPPDVPNKK